MFNSASVAPYQLRWQGGNISNVSRRELKHDSPSDLEAVIGVTFIPSVYRKSNFFKTTQMHNQNIKPRFPNNTT
jgi:hypothetical protein